MGSFEVLILLTLNSVKLFKMLKAWLEYPKNMSWE